MNKFTRVLAVAGISGALAVGGAGIAQASPDRAQTVKQDKNKNSHDKGKSGHDKHGKHHDHKHGKNHK